MRIDKQHELTTATGLLLDAMAEHALPADTAVTLSTTAQTSIVRIDEHGRVVALISTADIAASEDPAGLLARIIVPNTARH